ncbi:MAG: T9SS type A sorting domain-containing protein [Bacteroidota bacterium]
MKNTLLILAILTVCMQHAGAQVHSTPVHIINNLQHQRVWNAQTPAGAFGKTSNCGPDTVNYTFNKTTQFNAIALNNTTSGNTFYQWYPAPQSLTINGFDFFAWQSASTNAVVPVTCRIYSASIIDSLPAYSGTPPTTNPPLATVIVNVDSTFGGGLLSNMRRRAVFSAPVTVTGPYIISIENSSATNVSVITNSWTAGNGASEWLSSVRIGTNIIRSYNVNVGGPVFNADFIFCPYTSYSLTSDFTVSPVCNQGGNLMTYTNTSSPINFSRFYSLRAFQNLPQFMFTWDYGDSSGTFFTVNGSRTYNYRVPYTVSLKDSIIGWTRGCVDTRTRLINPAPSTPNANNNGPLCQGATLQLTADSIPGATYYWTGPNNFTSTLRNPGIAGVTSLQVGTYNVRAISGQCSSMVASTNFNIIATPNVQSNSPLCVGQTLNLAATAITGAVYAWSGPNGFSSSLSNPTKANMQQSDTGTYSVTMTVPGCGVIGPYTAYVAVNPVPPTPTASNNGPLCAGDNLNLTASSFAGGSYAWTGPNGFSSTQQNPSRPNVTTLMAGSYSVTLTANGCSSPSVSTTVSINNIPSPPTAGSNGPLCAGQSLSLTATSIPGATYTWSGPNNFSSTSQNPTRTNVGTIDGGVYSVFATVNGCPSTTATISVNITNNTPTPVAGSNAPLCPGQNLQLTASNITGATYSWTGPNSFTSNLQNPVINNVTAGQAGLYSVTATTSGCGTSSPGTVNIAVNTLPAAPTASNNGPLCDGQNINLTASNVTGGTYSWTGPNGFTSTAQNPVITNASALKAGNYSVSVTVAGCGTSPVGNTNVIVRRNPAQPAITANNQVCSGDTLRFSALSNAVGPNATYAWSGPGGYSSSNRTNEIANVSAAANAGTYSVIASDSGCSSPPASVTVSVKALPATPVASNGGNVCEGANINLFSTTIAGATYKWIGPNGFSSGAEDPIIIGVTPAASGSYSVQSIVNGCASAPASTSVLVNPKPASPTAGNNGPKCTGDNLSLTASAVAGASYSWSGPGGYSSSQQNPVLTNITTAMAGTYSVVAIVSGCVSGASTTDIVVGTPLPAPTLSNDKGSQLICAGDSIQFFATFVSGATYEWTGPAGFQSALNNPKITNLTPANSGTYNAVVNKNGCASAQGSIAINVNSRPNTSAISGPDTVRNFETQTTFSVTPTTGSIYQWSVTGGGVIFSGQNTSQIKVNWGAVNNAQVKVTETNIGGCKGTEKVQNVRVKSTVGVAELKKTTQPKIYPNPANNDLYVEIEAKQKTTLSINILNLVGQVVENLDVVSVQGLNKLHLDTQKLKAGIYFVQMVLGDETFTQKITIQ